MHTQAIKTRTFLEGENLLPFITSYIEKIPEKSVIVITSKIVALAERRTVIIKDSKTKEEAIRAESSFALKTKYVWLTIKDGMILPSAGIDESNANGKLILLPKDSFRSASLIRMKLQKYYRVKNLGIILTDSRTMPLRSGVVGIALGYAGFRGLRDYRGKPDIYGRKLKFSSTDVADSLATAAVLLMGEGDEKQPLALIQDVPVEFCERVNRNELHIDIEDDMFKPLFQKMLRR
ncbi:MAG: coenzyme F420-0:L-glutamate ligase [Candidatus Moraniibacteriota bacterium]|nr:MAG: coenzyme F420-0:L-glutamate ligase [Candidatus Moranbacteria bacterium]